MRLNALTTKKVSCSLLLAALSACVAIVPAAYALHEGTVATINCDGIGTVSLTFKKGLDNWGGSYLADLSIPKLGVLLRNIKAEASAQGHYSAEGRGYIFYYSGGTIATLREAYLRSLNKKYICVVGEVKSLY